MCCLTKIPLAYCWAVFDCNTPPVTLCSGSHIVEQSFSVLQNVQLRRYLCKSHQQRMKIQQDLQQVCLALMASKRQADHWKLKLKMGQHSLNKRQGRVTTLEKLLKRKNLKFQELRSSGTKQTQASPSCKKKSLFACIDPSLKNSLC